MNIWQKWTSISLVLRIFIGLVIGAILGFLVPSQEWISIFGDMFVGALKGIAPVLVFVLVASLWLTPREETRTDLKSLFSCTC